MDGDTLEKLEIYLENCYGIKKLDKKFKFGPGKVNSIYAKNGSMKTSLSKVFHKIQEGKQADICDEIFGSMPVVCNINKDNETIDKDEIFVIKSFEDYYESDNLASLLINNHLKQELDNVNKLKDGFLKVLEKRSGKKITRTVSGKKVYELEETIITDFGFDEKSLLLNLNNIDLEDLDYDYSDIIYSQIYDDSVIRKIKSDEFQEKISQYLDKSDEIYSMYTFFDKGTFTLPKLKDIQKGLIKNNFFVKENKIILNDDTEIKDSAQLKDKIKEIETQLTTSTEFKEIEKLLSDAKGMLFKDIIETFPQIIEELKLDKLEDFKKKIWLSYITAEIDKFNELKGKYNELDTDIHDAELDDTPWKEALNIFNNRFTVPFHMEISNLRSSIIGESIPKVIFGFCKDGDVENRDENNWVKLDRDEVESKNTLSQGEKRALYLLNIIFDIEKRRRENQKTLFIIDDIADSFDYKNKYAIIEYLKEISLEDNFYMIILSHNFDFYRAVSSRLGLKRSYRHEVHMRFDEVKIERELYQDKPFMYWKTQLNKKHIIALIPFVRNLIEYGADKEVNDFQGIQKDYLLLTNLLHIKEHTYNIKIADLKKIYKEYIDNDNFIQINEDKTVLSVIDEIALEITETDISLENKIILSVAIRLVSERYMINEIENSNCNFTWNDRSGSVLIINKEEALSNVLDNGNQTRGLFGLYEQIGDHDKIKILDSVNIMTPENIHINSFMYEPILDMDIIELKKLYDDVCGLECVHAI